MKILSAHTKQVIIAQGYFKSSFTATDHKIEYVPTPAAVLIDGRILIPIDTIAYLVLDTVKDAEPKDKTNEPKPSKAKKE